MSTSPSLSSGLSESDIIARVEAAGNKITKKDGDGSVYVCQMKGGKPNGYGTMTGYNGATYFGQWKNGKWNGNGTCTYADGDKYVGEWKNDKHDGNGTYTMADGAKYVGEYKDHKYDGQGTLTSPDGTILHSGEWEKNEPKKDDKTKIVS